MRSSCSGRQHGYLGCISQGGGPIEPNDKAIAGHVIAADAVLVKNNTQEFARVPGMTLENWLKKMMAKELLLMFKFMKSFNISLK
ncbi:hypothetical protein ENINCK372B1_18295 [Enterobacter intestinihominis]